MEEKMKPKKHQAIPWTDKKVGKLRELFPTASWEDLKKAFPEYSQDAITRKAAREDIERKMGKATEQQEDPNAPTTDENLAEYMTRGRTAKDLSQRFPMSVEEAERRIEKGFEGYDLFKGPDNAHGEHTYVAVPKVTNARMPRRSWELRQAE